jgi:hypothetical protein
VNPAKSISDRVEFEGAFEVSVALCLDRSARQTTGIIRNDRQLVRIIFSVGEWQQLDHSTVLAMSHSPATVLPRPESLGQKGNLHLPR